MTKRYARFIPDAQKRITSQAETVMKGMLKNGKVPSRGTAKNEA